MVKKPQLLKRLEVRLVRAVWRWQRREARRQGVTAPLRGGCRRLHAVVRLDVAADAAPACADAGGAQWTTKPLEATSFSGEAVEVAPPTDDDVAGVLARVLRQAKKDFAQLDASWPEDEYEKRQRESLQRPLGLGKKKDKARNGSRGRELAEREDAFMSMGMIHQEAQREGKTQRPLAMGDMRQQRGDAQARLDGAAVGARGTPAAALAAEATSRDLSQPSHVTSEKPYRMSPQRWYALASRFIRCGTESHTRGQSSSKPCARWRHLPLLSPATAQLRAR